MFRNFGKVFSFSLHNQVGTKSYKIFTIVFALLLLVMPSIVMMLAASHHGEEEEKPLESCGAEMVYIVSDFDATPNLMLFNEVTEDNYKNIKYKNADSIDAALASACSRTAAAFLRASVISSSSLARSAAARTSDFIRLPNGNISFDTCR